MEKCSDPLTTSFAMNFQTEKEGHCLTEGNIGQNVKHLFLEIGEIISLRV